MPTSRENPNQFIQTYIRRITVKNTPSRGITQGALASIRTKLRIAHKGASGRVVTPPESRCENGE